MFYLSVYADIHFNEVTLTSKLWCNVSNIIVHVRLTSELTLRDLNASIKLAVKTMDTSNVCACKKKKKRN